MRTFYERVASLEGVARERPDSTISDLAPVSLATPATPTVTPGGTSGSTSYSYVVADSGNVGLSPSAAGSTALGNATLSASNYNRISFTSVAGHVYLIYRSASSGTPSTTGLIGAVVATGTTSTFDDTGLGASGNVPTANTTGCLLTDGPLYCGGLELFNASVPANSETTGQTLSIAQTLTPLLDRSGAATVSDTTPTAAAMVAALPGVRVSQSYVWRVRNRNSGTLTIVAGNGITLATGNTNTIAAASTRAFLVVFTNVSPGAEAVTMYSLGVGVT